jgi:hypothetical protein
MHVSEYDLKISGVGVRELKPAQRFGTPRSRFGGIKCD